MQIVLGITQGERYVNIGAFAVNVQVKQRILSDQQDRDPCSCHENRDERFHTHRRAYPFHISFSVELSGIDTGAGDSAEQRQRIDKQKLSHDGYGGHRFRAETSDHDVIDKPDRVGDAVLDHHGDCQKQRAFYDKPAVHAFSPFRLDSIIISFMGDFVYIRRAGCLRLRKNNTIFIIFCVFRAKKQGAENFFIWKSLSRRLLHPKP